LGNESVAYNLLENIETWKWRQDLLAKMWIEENKQLAYATFFKSHKPN
jgi:hypothetical protein